MRSWLITAKIVGIVVKTVSEVKHVVSGGVSADEAEAMAVKLVADEDMRVEVNGVDIIDAGAQTHLAAALARIARNLVAANLSR